MSRSLHVSVSALCGALAFAAMPASAACPMFTSPLVVKMPERPLDLLIDDQCQYIYATNPKKNRVEVLSLSTGKLQTPIAVGENPAGLDISPDGTMLYVANAGGQSISVVNLAQKAEVRKVAVPRGQYSQDFPFALAVAQTGKVFFTNTYPMQGQGTRVMQLDPRTDTMTERTDAPYGRDIKASGDRTVMGVIGLLGVARYTTALDAFGRAKKPQTNSASDIAFDRTGSVALLNVDPYVLDSRFDLAGSMSAGENFSYGVAVNQAGNVGYHVVVNGIAVLDLKRFRKIGTLPIGDKLTEPSYSGKNGVGQVALSKDDTVLAVITDNGLSIMRTSTAPSVASAISVVAFSPDAMGNQSLLGFHNTGEAAGTVTITLSNLTTGGTVAEWTSPAIAPGAAPQFAISTIESAAPLGIAKPPFYVAKIRATVTGTFSHVLWGQNARTLTNLSTCSNGLDLDAISLTGVQSSLLKDSYVSEFKLTNTGSLTPTVTLGIFDARNGNRLGTYTSKPLAPGTGQVVTMPTIETEAGFTPTTGMNSYVVKSENQFSGFVQHIIRNRTANLFTDMTAVCALPAS